MISSTGYHAQNIKYRISSTGYQVQDIKYRISSTGYQVQDIKYIKYWKKGMELKGLRVNIGKTKVMRCQVRIGQAEDSGKYPCGVCREGVGDNSIKCVACHRWVHKRCVFQVD